MAQPSVLKQLRKGMPQWNTWRLQHPQTFIDLRGANLQGANLRGGNLGCNNRVEGIPDNLVDLHTDFRGADLRGADLSGANLRGADLREVNFQGADLRGANLSYANLRGADLSRINLSGANLNRVHLSGADLSYADLQQADLSYADLRQADLQQANLSYADLQQADLSYADLRQADLSEANLSTTQLIRIMFWGTHLCGVRFRGTDLRGADLNGADLSGASLSGADLSEANLSKAKLIRANLSRADLSRVNLSYADLSYADLSRALLSGASLNRALLNGANLDAADLREAKLIDANLSGADLSRINLSYADLSGADLNGVNLDAADLNGANLDNTLLSPKADHNPVISASDPILSLSGSLVVQSATLPTSQVERMMQHIQPIQVLYCYTPQDRKLRDQLETHLILLKRLRQITLRLNREIPTGINWKEAQDAQFHQADLILLLVSPDFIASDYHYGIEMRNALEKHKAGNVWVIPILLRSISSDWQQTPLGILQVLPQNRKAITEQPKRDQVLADIVKRIGEVVSLLLLKKYPSLQAENASKATQVLGPFCPSCEARNPYNVSVCENCGDLLL